MDKELEKRLKKLHKKKILITGGLGMIGSTIAHKLVENGAHVTLIDAFIKPYGANYFNINGIENKVTINISDIRDKESIKELVSGKDIIFNLAGQVSHNDSLKNPYLDADINYIGQLNVLEAARIFAPKATVLFAGSRLQFGDIEKIPVSEDHPLRPKTPYSLNKCASENLHLFYHRVHSLSTVVFRIANPYGPRAQMRHSKYCIINWFLRLAMDNQTITVYGDGNQLRDYICIDDLAEAFIFAAIEESAAGEVFNIGSGVGTRFKDMANLIIKIVKKGKVEHVSWPEEYINVETGNYISDIGKAIRMLGWAPKTSLVEGVKRMFSYYQENRKYYWNS